MTGSGAGGFIRAVRCPLSALFAAAALCAAGAAEPPRPFLWKVSDGDAKSFVFGTIHVSDPRVTKLPEPVTAALEKTDALYTEIASDEETLMEAQQHMFLPGDQTLTGILPEEVRTQLDAELRAIDPMYSVAFVDRFKIWALAASLTLLEDQLRSEGRPSLDVALYLAAAEAGKRTGALESVAEQVAVFELLSQEEQIEYLRGTLAYLADARERGEPVLEEMIQVYAGGDLDALHELVEDSMSAEGFELKPEFRSALFEDRNARMAERMARLMRLSPETVYFFAVGAGHLPGAEGVLKLLEADGFKVERVESLNF